MKIRKRYKQVLAGFVTALFGVTSVGIASASQNTDSVHKEKTQTASISNSFQTSRQADEQLAQPFVGNASDKTRSFKSVLNNETQDSAEQTTASTTALSAASNTALNNAQEDAANAFMDSEEMRSVQELLEKSEEGVDSEKSIILNAMGRGVEVEKVLDANVSLTLDLSTPAQDKELSKEEEALFDTLPSVDSGNGKVDIRNSDSGMSFSLSPENSYGKENKAGAVVSENAAGIYSVSHVDKDLKGQIVSVVKDENVDYVDFSFDIPSGYSLFKEVDGSISLMDLSSNVVGKIDIPWAVDVRGVKLATSFELLEDSNVVRQHFDASKAVFPVAVDPSWWWWVGTAATCAAQVTPFVVSGGVAIVGKVGKVVSRINSLKKHKSIKNAIKNSGGVKNFAILVVKNTYNKIHNSMPKYVKKVLKSPFKMSKKQQWVVNSTAWAFTYQQIADWVGLGSCASLYREIRRYRGAGFEYCFSPVRFVAGFCFFLFKVAF